MNYLRHLSFVFLFLLTAVYPSLAAELAEYDKKADK